MKEIIASELDIAAWRRVKDVIRLRLFDLNDGSDWSVKAGIVAGRKRGPIVSVVAGQHGDDWNGIFIAHRLFEKIENRDMTGTLVVLPIANPYAFLHKSRLSVVDEVDMNRSYGIGGERRPTSMAANVLLEELFLKSNFVIDIHTGGPGAYIANAGIMDQARFELASHLNCGNIVVAHQDHGTLVAAAERHGVPAVSLQVGRARDVYFDACEEMVDGIINFLKAVKLISDVPKTTDNQQLFTDKTLLLAPDSGFLHLDVALGDDIEQGRRVGKIKSLFGTAAEVITPESGRVLYVRREPIVSRGDCILHLGRLEEGGR